MNKVKEIVIAWATSMNPTEEQREIAEKRLETCMGCEFWESTGLYEKPLATA